MAGATLTFWTGPRGDAVAAYQQPDTDQAKIAELTKILHIAESQVV